MPSPEELLGSLRQNDPERYARLSAPFPSEEAMVAAFTGFFRELGELREKYGIADVLTIVADSYETPEGTVKPDTLTMQYGDMTLRPFLVLHLYRQEPEMIQILMKGITMKKPEQP